MKQTTAGIARNSWYTLLTLISIVGLRFLITVFIVRALGPVGQGTYYLLITFSALTLQITSLGIGTANSVFLSKQRYTLAEVNTASVILAGLLGLATAGIYYVLSPTIYTTLLKDVEVGYGWFVVGVLPLGLYGAFWQGIMLGLERISQLNKIELGSTIFQLSSLVVFLKLGYGLSGALLAWGMGLLMIVIAGWWIVARAGSTAWCFNIRLMRHTVQFGFASQWGEVARMLIVRGDVFLLNLLLGPEVVGYYSVALSLAEKLWLVYTSMYRAAIRRLQSLSEEQATRLLTQVTSGMSLVVSVIAVGLGISSPWLMSFLYGPQYIRSVVPFIILLTGLVPFGVWAGIKIYITGQLYRPNLTSAIQWGASLVSIIIYYNLIYHYGIIGAALGSTLSYSFLCFMGIYVLSRLVQVRPLDFFIIRKDELLSYSRLGLKQVSQLTGIMRKI